MKDYNLSNSLYYESGIYWHSSEARASIDPATRRKTIRRRIRRKLRNEHFMASKIKIAVCIFILFTVLVNLLIG